jgi:hypothetical protein
MEGACALQMSVYGIDVSSIYVYITMKQILNLDLSILQMHGQLRLVPNQTNQE